VIRLQLPAKPDGEPLRVLCLGAHSDDIEIGCGGAILRLKDEYPEAEFHWVVFSAQGVREREAREGANLFAGGDRLRGLHLKDFRDGFMPFNAVDLKQSFEDLKSGISPDLIFTHTRKDAHQDHRIVSDLTWNTFRNDFILEYEIPKYDGDLGQPGVFVPLDDAICKRKIDYLLKAFGSQCAKHWFEPETFRSLMRLRGMECHSPSGYAEAFHCRKLVL